MIASIPLQNIPNQRISTIVNQQSITIDLNTRGDRGLFADIYLGANLIAAGVKCNNLTYLNQYPTAMRGFLYFQTTTGNDPTYLTFGTQAVLYYADFDVLTDYYNAWVKKNG